MNAGKTKPINVAVVDDDDSVRLSLRLVFRNSESFCCTCLCRDAFEALAKLPESPPDVVLMDIRMPGLNGIECTRQLKQVLPKVKIIMLSVLLDPAVVTEAYHAGASGYLLKPWHTPELFSAIEDVLHAKLHFCEAATRCLLDAFRPADRNPEALALLSPKEQEVLEEVAQGYCDKEIADRLHIAESTVKTHLIHSREKMHAQNRTDAAVKFIGPRAKLLPLP